MEFIDLKSQRERIRKEIDNSINRVLDHGQFILGPEVTELEFNLAQFTNTEHCVTCANGTDAIVLALRSLDISPGDEVIIPSFTFFATAEAVSTLGAIPVFVDIDKETYNISVSETKKAITSKTKAIIAVSLYGLCPDLEQLFEIAKNNNIYLIEDAAQSFGASISNRRSCSIAHISCTSFFPSKPLGCYGDGGACFTNDKIIANKLRELRTHGQEKRYSHSQIGYNSRLDTIQAAILLEKLKIFEDEIKNRNIVAERYQMQLKDYFKIQKIPEGHTSIFGQFTIEVENRAIVQEKLKENGIPTAVHYPTPLHLQPVYKSQYGHLSLPISTDASQKVMSLPMHPYLKKDEQEFIIKNLIKLSRI